MRRGIETKAGMVFTEPDHMSTTRIVTSPDQVLSIDQIVAGESYSAESIVGRTRMTAVTGAYSNVRDKDKGSLWADFQMDDGSIQQRSLTDASVIPYAHGRWNNSNRLIKVAGQ